MRKITDISYDNRVHVQTLYQRIRARNIPVLIDKDGSYAIGEEYIPMLLTKGQMGRPRVDKEKKPE